jgi:hypothetical protein
MTSTFTPTTIQSSASQAITADLLSKAELLALYIGNRSRSNLDLFSFGIEKSEVERILAYWRTLLVQPTSDLKRYKVLSIENKGNGRFYYRLTETGKIYYDVPSNETYETTSMLVALAHASQKTLS